MLFGSVADRSEVSVVWTSAGKVVSISGGNLVELTDRILFGKWYVLPRDLKVGKSSRFNAVVRPLKAIADAAAHNDQ